jgi:transcriptional regulator with XRE-family HTH domain
MLRPTVMIAGMAAVPVGRQIRLRRQALKWSQQELADKLGVNRATVSAWERGKHLPERTEGAIAAVLGISLTGPDDDEVYTDPVELAIWEDPRLPRSEKLAFIAQLRARRMEHVPRAHEPPAG